MNKTWWRVHACVVGAAALASLLTTVDWAGWAHYAVYRMGDLVDLALVAWGFTVCVLIGLVMARLWYGPPER